MKLYSAVAAKYSYTQLDFILIIRSFIRDARKDNGRRISGLVLFAKYVSLISFDAKADASTGVPLSKVSKRCSFAGVTAFLDTGYSFRISAT